MRPAVSINSGHFAQAYYINNLDSIIAEPTILSGSWKGTTYLWTDNASATVDILTSKEQPVIEYSNWPIEEITPEISILSGSFTP